MLHPLPAETVFEARERARRDTRLLFVLLIGLYFFFFNLLVFAAVPAINPELWFDMVRHFWRVLAASSLLAVLAAWLQYESAKAVPLDKILVSLGARPADPGDEYHKRLINVIEEAQAATGIRPIRAAIIPTVGSNAFSAEDGKWNSAIGVTEGLLAKLTRGQLTAVIAHEAAHLANGDTRLKTLACSLFGVFHTIRSWMSGSDSQNRARLRGRTDGRVALVRVLVWVIASLGYFFTKFVYMAISRTREHLADAHAVQMCKDPMGMAEALYKIAGKYRGSAEIPDGYSALFIMNPRISKLDEESGFLATLFTTHPPTMERVELMLGWAKADLKTFVRKQGSSAVAGETAGESAPAAPQFYGYRDGEWVGPHTPAQMFDMGFLTPDTWICPVNSETVVRAADQGAFLPLFQAEPTGRPGKFSCPRCNVPLVEIEYEGADVGHCRHCKGHLLRDGVIERIITRRDKSFMQNEKKRAKAWKSVGKRLVAEACPMPKIRCPACKTAMEKYYHSFLIRVVLDRCFNSSCAAVWCDAGELEAVQILVEEASEE